MIKIKVKQLIDSKNAFDELLGIEMQASAAYKIARLAKAANDELATIQKSLDKLTEKYVDREKGQFLDSGAKQKYVAEFEELGETEIKILADPLDISMLDDVKIKSGILLLLEWAFED